MRIAQISDFHYTHLTWNPLKLFSKRILGNLNWILARKGEFSFSQLDVLPDLFRTLDVDLVLFGGDFTTTALPQEYASALQFMKQLSQPWIAVPGNHDHYTFKSFREKRFYRYFANQKKESGNPLDFFTLEHHGVEAHRIGAQWWVVALDTARATHFTSSRGLLSEEKETYLQELLDLIPKNASILMLNHYPFLSNCDWRHSLEGKERLKAIVQKDPRILMYLQGHTHRHTIADLQPSHLPILLDSGSAALSKGGSWNLIDIQPNGCEIIGYQWTTQWEPYRKEQFLWTRQ